MLWGLINCIPTGVMALVMGFGDAFQDNDFTAMITWLMGTSLCDERAMFSSLQLLILTHLSYNTALVVIIVVFAVIFAVNSSIHSFLVVNYAKSDKVAVSVGFYYMSNAMGRLMGTIGSGILYTYVGEYVGPLAGNDAVAGMAACFLAGTICSLVAVVVTQRIEDNSAGLKCGSCLTIVQAENADLNDDDDAAEAPTDASERNDNSEVEYSKGSKTEHTATLEASEIELWA